MSREPLPNNVCSASRTPSGSPLTDVTMANGSSCTWARTAADSEAPSVTWPPAGTADQRLNPTATRSRIRCIRISGTISIEGGPVSGRRTVEGPHVVLITPAATHALDGAKAAPLVEKLVSPRHRDEGRRLAHDI